MDNREIAPLDTFEDLFRHLSGHAVPHDWQRDDLAADTTCGNRLIRIPTGFGNTLGVLAAWIFHRLVRQDAAWPRRLVWCLPCLREIRGNGYPGASGHPSTRPPSTSPAVDLLGATY